MSNKIALDQTGLLVGGEPRNAQTGNRLCKEALLPRDYLHSNVYRHCVDQPVLVRTS